MSKYQDFLDTLQDDKTPEPIADNKGNTVMYQGVQKYLDGDLVGAKVDLAEAKRLGITGNTNLAYAMDTIDREQKAIAKIGADTPVDPAPLPSHPADYLDSFLDEDSELTKNYKDIPATDPDYSAKIIDIAGKTGQSAEFVEENLQEAETASKAKPDDYWRRVEEDYPGTTKWLREGQNMAVAHDDVDNLGMRESLVRDVGESMELLLDPGKRILAADRAFRGAVKKVPAGFTSGTLQVRQSELGWTQAIHALSTGEHDPTFDHELGGIEKKLSEYHAKEEKFNPFYYAAQQVPNLMLMAQYGAKRGMQGGLVFGLGAAAIGQIPPLTVVPEELATVPAATALGMAAGGRIGALEAVAILEGGAAYREFSQLKDKNGNPVNPRLAAEMALVVGIANAGLEYASLFALLRTIPGGTRILGHFSKEKGLFRGLTSGAAVRGAAKRYLVSMGAEAGTEVMQEGVSIGVGEIGKAISGQQFEPIAPGEAARQIGGVISPAIQATMLLGLPGTTIHIAGEINKFQQTDVMREAFVKLGEMAEQSKLIERSPEALGNHLNSITAGTELQDVYIPADAFAEYCKKNDLDPKELAAKLGIDTLYQEAVETHGDIKIPSGDWAVAAIKVGKDMGRNIYQELTDDTKSNPEAYTKRQKDELGQLYQEQFTREAERIIKEDPAQEIVKQQESDRIYKELVEAGRPEKEAKASAELFSGIALSLSAQVETLTPEQASTALVSKIHGVEDIEAPDRAAAVTPEITETNIETARKKLYSQTKAEVDAMPEYQASEYLRKKLGPGYKKIAIRAMERDILARNQRQLFESAADAFGLGDAESLLKLISEMPKREDTIRDMVDTKLSATFGDPRFYQYANEQLTKAKEMFDEDKPADEIQQNTGWINEDGQWRYSPGFGVFGPGALYQMAPPTESEAFKKWFGDSKVVDDQGEPLVVYHGTTEKIKAFSKETLGEKSGHPTSFFGFWFDETFEGAREYADKDKNIVSAYLSIKNPYRMSASSFIEEFLEHGRIDYEAKIDEVKEIFEEEEYSDYSVDNLGWNETVYDQGSEVSREGLPEELENALAELDEAKTQWEDFDFRDLFDDEELKEKVLHFKDEATQQGYDGIIIKPDHLQGDEWIEFRNTQYISFEPTQIKSVFNRGTWSQTDPDILKQAAAGAFDPRTKDVLLSFKKANASTFIHETAHAWLTLVDELVKDNRASESLVADHTKLMVWLGAEYGKPLTTEQQEKFAASFEAYLREGKAPTVELRPAFARFKRWLTMIYRSIQEIGGGILGDEGISPEVREIMDRMLATEDEINSAEKIMDPSDMTFEWLDPKVTAKLDKLRQKAHDEAADELLKQQIAEIATDRKAFLASERQRITTEVTEALNDDKLHLAIKSMADSEKAARTLAEAYIAGELEEGSEGWLNFDITAEMLDFYSGEELAKQIIAKSPFEQEVSDMVDARMNEAYADLKDTDAIRDEAMKAVHSDRQLEVLALERELLKARVEDAQGRAEAHRYTMTRVWMEAEVAKSQARKVVARLKLSEIRSPEKYFTAERIAAVRVAKAIARKDYGKAAQHKHTQLLNHALGLAVIKAKKQIDKAFEQIKKISKIKQDKLFTQETFVQVHQILFRFGFMNDSNRFARKETLDQYLERVALAFQSGEGDESNPLDLPGWILDEGTRIVTNNLTTEQLEDVKDALQNIVHVARMTNRFYVMAEKESIGEMAGILADVAEKNVGKKKPGRAVEKLKERFSAATGDYFSSLDTADTVFNALDGAKDFGIWYKTFFTAVKDAADKEGARRWELIGKMNKIWSAYSNKEISEIHNKKLKIPEFGLDNANPLYKHQLFAMALNMGNKTSEERVLDTRPVNFPESFEWNRANRENTKRIIMGVLQQHLDKRDWKFVRDIWELVNSSWEEISALHKRVTGFEPKKVEAVPFEVVLPDGERLTMPGGYYPLAEDPRFSEKAAEREMLALPVYTESNPGFKAMTKAGHTKPRTGAQYAVLLKLDLISMHLNDITHDLYFRELIIDLRRLGANTTFVDGVKSTAGEPIYRYIDNWIKSVATGRNIEKFSLTTSSRMIRALDQHSVGSIIMANVGVLLQNFANPFLVGGRVEGFGHGAAAKAFFIDGLLKYYPKVALAGVGWKAAARFDDWICSKSSYMKDRKENPAFTLQRYKGITAQMKKSPGEFFFGLLAGTDGMTVKSAWAAAYNQKLKETGNEKESINYADLLVSRVVPSGRKYDQPQIIRSGSDVDKIVTRFYSFWSVEYNNWARELNKQGKQPIKNAPRFMGFVASRMMFVYTSALLAGHGPDPEWDFAKKITWWAKEFAMYPISFFPFFRGIASLALDKGLGLPSYGYRPLLMMSAVEDMGHAVLKLKKRTTGEASDQEVVESLAKLASVAFPYPRQFNSWFFNAYDYITNGMEPIFKDLYRRRPMRKR